MPVAAGGDCEVCVSRDGGEGDDVAVHEALLVVVRVRQVGQVQLLELQDLKECCKDEIKLCTLSLICTRAVIILGADLSYRMKLLVYKLNY